MKWSKHLFLYIAMILCSNTWAQQDSISIKNLFEISLDEFLNIDVETGSLTENKNKNLPFALTTITNEQIVMSTAKNIASLLEQYVPGLNVMTHSEGDKIGMRGHIAAENYKLILLVNGKNITNNVYEGVITEIDMWDLNDIEKIEVIRGPGTVTYGPGAIAGVINIVTKSSDTKDIHLLSVSPQVASTYRSYGTSLQFSKKINKWGVYSFASYRKTNGEQNPNYYKMDIGNESTNRFVGKEPSNTAPPQDYLADGLDRPQIKAHLQIKHKNGFSVFSRYTQSGQTHQYREKIYDDSQKQYVNQRQVTLRSFGVFPEYKKNLNDHLISKTSIGYHTQEYIRYDFENKEYKWDHPNNIKDYAFSYSKTNLTSILEYNPNDRLKLIGGVEYLLSGVKSPWGKTHDHLLIREGLYYISDTINSVYYNDNSPLSKTQGVEQIGKGLHIHTYSAMFEGYYKFDPLLQLNISARIDKPSISKAIISPKFVILSELDEYHSIRFIAQRSCRMMPLRAQYLYHTYNASSSSDYKNEYLDGLELIYTGKINDYFLLNFSPFYNMNKLVGYTGNDLQVLGKQKLYGIDGEIKFEKGKTKASFNHAYIKQISFEMSPELKNGENRNNITFSDYDYTINKGVVPLNIQSYGNDLNNIPRNISKFWISQSFLKNKATISYNGVIYWDFKGSYDEMYAYEAAYNRIDVSALSVENQALFIKQKADFEKEKSLLEEQNAYKTQFKSNLSFSYLWSISKQLNLRTVLYVDNIIGDNKKYYVSTGSNDTAPTRLQFTQESRYIGVKMFLEFK